MDARGIIGNYLVERELGRGGMGIVYAAKHRVLGRPAAIKLLLASSADDRGRVERFFNEARAAMAIDHPGVVKIFDVGISAEDRPYIAMELLDGVSLASLLGAGGLPIRQAVDYACQIASALAAAHDAGVIHRDLKPENIIITRDRSRAIVVDFGIAKLANQATVRTATGALVGTPLYMSPEQCEGLRELDARSDLYAFGCVIFAMVTGRPPFFEGGTGGLIGMHLHVAPPSLRSRCPQASEALERVVSVLLAKSPDARFRTARATLAALSAPEVRNMAAAPGVPATADFTPGTHSIGPWGATSTSAPAISPSTHAPPISPSMHAQHAVPPSTAFGTPASRDAWTQVTGADVRGPRTAHVPMAGTPPPSSVAGSSTSIASPPRGPALRGAPAAPIPTLPNSAGPPSSRRRLLGAIVASSAVTAVIAVLAARGCGGPSSGARDAGTGTGSGVVSGASGSNRGGAGGSTVATGSNTTDSSSAAGSGSVAGSNTSITMRDVGSGARDGSTKARARDVGGQPRASDSRRTQLAKTIGKDTRLTTTSSDGGGSSSAGLSPTTGAGPGSAPSPQPEEPTVPVRVEIHDQLLFAKGDFGASLAQQALDRVVAHHRRDPTRRIVITGHAEQDEPGVLEKLAGARANTAYTHLASRGVPRDVLVVSSTRYIDPATPNGVNRRVTIDFE